ncbi:putative response regulator [Penicillium brasilianum]|uniref:Putative response regulator n=1 Tax=Penicillium brasilianum TaxID=104259 RepID=A0A1S9RJJ6_PENBI|nr:putative response regulator [Penicillium brasilianum]
MPERRLSRLLRAKLLRRSSTPAVPKTGDGADPRVHPNSTSRSSCAPHLFDSASEKSPYSVVSSAADHSSEDIGHSPGSDIDEGHKHKHGRPADPQPSTRSSQPTDPFQHRHASERPSDTPLPSEPNFSPLHTPISEESPSPFESPLPTPQQSDDTSYSAPVKARGPTPAEYQLTPTLDTVVEKTADDRRPPSTAVPSSWGKRPSIAIRRQSLLPASQQHLIGALLEQSLFSSSGDQGSSRVPVAAAEMVQRRIWVKRPGGSATLVPCLEDAVVDELRDQVIMKYANSLGRTFDSPDIVIRISAREGSNRQQTPERLLSPEEVVASVLDSYYPGGQTVEEALLIEAPTRRTPKPSPRHPVYLHHHSEPGEHGDYFPLMPVNPKGHTPPAHPASAGATNAPSISILTTGVAPALPSPGTRAARHHRRPPLTRHTTNSPTILGQPPTITDNGVSPHTQPPSIVPTQPTPPAPVAESPQAKSHTPPAPVASPRTLRKSKGAASPGAVFGGLIEGTVPPINVLIVEDNIINQKLLEAFMKRLSVRWKCAANGEEAVRKWRQGGFHLVLMDIQLPVMNGLDATKEIRRLERLNGIGVFPKTASGRSSASSAASLEKRPGLQRSVSEDDTLSDLSLFRSPVIIVALTASSLQSDRHEALAAGCNDFLTKPVGFPWLSQKVTEWGCMQALIDFDGWRKWRGFQDSPRSASPGFDSAASPMQTGNQNEIGSKMAPGSPSLSRTGTKTKAARPKRPHLPDADEIMREDSWGSGSGDTADSPTSPETTPGVDADIEPPGDSVDFAPNAK